MEITSLGWCGTRPTVPRNYVKRQAPLLAGRCGRTVGAQRADVRVPRVANGTARVGGCEAVLVHRQRVHLQGRPAVRQASGPPFG
jgi:hypothetical protein